MGRSVASLGVSVKAKTGGFSKGMKRAKGSAKGFGRALGGLKSKLLGIGASLAAVAGAGAIGLLVKKQFEAIDTTTKLADSLGIQTQALVGLQHAAEITGVGTEGMNKAMEKFTRNLGDAATKGIGPAKDSLDLLGLSAADLIKMKPEEAFGVFAEAVNGLGTQAEKTSVSVGLMGRTGGAMLNTFALGKKGLAEMAQEAEDLGLAFSRVDAAKIEASNDAITRMKAGITGIARQAAVKLAPVVAAIANSITEWIKKAGGAREAFAGMFEVAALGAAHFMQGMDLLSSFVDGLRAVIAKFVAETLSGLGTVVGAVETLADAVGVGFGTEASEAINNLSAGFQHTFEEAWAAAEESMARFVAGSAVAETKEFFADLERKANAAAEAVAESVAPKTQGVGSFIGGFLKDLRGVGKKVRETQEELTKSVGNEFLKSAGGFLKGLVGAFSKKDEKEAGARLFAEVDLTKQSISLSQTQVQKTEDTHSAESLEVQKDMRTALRRGVVGVMGR